jgi:hypothetical protein
MKTAGAEHDVARWEHSEISASCEDYAKHINTLWGQITELSYGKAGGTYIYHCTLLDEFDSGANSKGRVRDQCLKVGVNSWAQNRAVYEVSSKSQQKLIKHQEEEEEKSCPKVALCVQRDCLELLRAIRRVGNWEQQGILNAAWI